jgi:hypothetical protein
VLYETVLGSLRSQPQSIKKCSSIMDNILEIAIDTMLKMSGKWLVKIWTSD